MPKQPQDHKTKADPNDTVASAAQDLGGEAFDVEFNDHTYRVDPSQIDDIEFMEAVADARTDKSGDATIAVLVLMVKSLLGTDSPGEDDDGEPLPSQYDRWKREQREELGKVNSETIKSFMEAVQAKNS